MITWFEAPKEGLSPGGKIEFQTLTATENKTYSEDGVAYTSVTVNVEGGGGSSDFSTAEVTVTNSTVLEVYGLGAFVEADNMARVHEFATGTTQASMALYKESSSLWLDLDGETVVVSGNITESDEYNYIVTGDCTITIS